MRLEEVSIKFDDWELDKLRLGELNLIVGRNSTGKTRVLNALDALHKMVSKTSLYSGKFEFTLCSDSISKIQYSFEADAKRTARRILSEKISLNDKAVYLRGEGETAEIKSMVSGIFEKIHPPSDSLVLHARRDTEDYPYLEEISNWAYDSYGFRFGNLSPFLKIDTQRYDFLTMLESIPDLLEQMLNVLIGKDHHLSLLEELKSLGYPIEKISVQDRGDHRIIFVKETGINTEIPQHSLSQGLLRGLSILIWLEFLLTFEEPATLIIDDLCEGLDYDRATKLGKLVFDKCLNSNVQLIATSNDSFLMDVVDIKYWNILQREGSKVTSINIHTHPQLFEDFKFTGLSNFDFFSSDFIQQKL